MNNVLIMKILHSFQNLEQHDGSIDFFSASWVSIKIRVEVPTCEELLKDVEIGVGFEDFLQTSDVRMIEIFEDLKLSEYSA